MRKASVFEACIVILLIILAGLLIFVMTSPPPAIGNWELNGTGKIDYMVVGSDDTLYTFRGNNITAIRSNGIPAWTYTAPENYTILNTVRVWVQETDSSLYGTTFSPFPVMDEEAGSIYLYAYKNLTPEEVEQAMDSYYGTSINHPAMIIALSPQGQVRWEYLFNLTIPTNDLRYRVNPEEYSYDRVISITAKNDRVYLFHDDVEEVVGRNGKLLFTIRNMSAPLSIDENGYLYGVSTNRQKQIYGGHETDSPQDTFNPRNLRIGTSRYDETAFDDETFVDVVESYSPNGTMAWRQSIGQSAVQPFVVEDLWQQYNTLPLYCNGTLYVPIRNGVVALRPNGDFRWACQIPEGNYTLFEYMPLDSQGNVYMKSLTSDWREQKVEVRTISPQGYVQPGSWEYDDNDETYRLQPYVGPLPVAGKNAIIYAVESNGQIDNLEFYKILDSKQFGSGTITAYDIKTATPVWNFTVPMEDRHIVTIDEDNFHQALTPAKGYFIGPNTDSQTTLRYGRVMTNETQPLMPATIKDVKICTGNDITYINYYSAIYDAPIILNRSRCIYAKGLYAVSNNGSLIWSKSMDGFIDSMAATNRTVYYSTLDGRIGSSGASSVAAGITLAAFIYLFLRFFMVGAVARARGRIDQNKNRVQMLQYVIDHPGATAVDVSRDLKMNSGTIRYHLFVLTMKHKVVTYQDGDKYLRYFKNSGAFTAEERTFLSLARREPIRKVLKILGEKPGGLSSLELANELGISNTATHRHVSLLLEKGVVDRKMEKEKGYVYTIREQYRLHVDRIMDRT